jgi:hypothetical protein
VEKCDDNRACCEEHVKNTYEAKSVEMWKRSKEWKAWNNKSKESNESKRVQRNYFGELKAKRVTWRDRGYRSMKLGSCLWVERLKDQKSMKITKVESAKSVMRANKYAE